MRCAQCGHQNRRQDKTCARYGAGLKPARLSRGMRLVHAGIWVLAGLITLIVLSLLIYRVYFWVDAWKTDHYYERTGRLEPSVEQVTLDNGLAAHSITFFGNDGDHIFLEELRQSYQITGGLARIDIPDSNWFSANPEDVEGAIVTLTPVLYTEGNDRRELPVLTMEIEAPRSPLTLINPSGDFAHVNTSTYLLSFRVVPGSQVLVGNDDVTDVVNFEGLAEVNIDIFPQGDNPVSILVSTPNHKQTRQEINLYRPYQEINLEPSLSVATKTNLKGVRITGSMDPQAVFSVDTPHDPESVKVDEKGNFSFTAMMSTIGDNTVTFRASQEGKTDSVVSITVYYVPSLNAYSRSAWKMDYPALSAYYETWMGRVFLCDGIVTAVWTDEDEEQTVVIDVSGEGEEAQNVVLTNLSSVGTPQIGARYKAYADVIGHEYYDTKDCPKLVARYMILQSEPAQS